MTGSTALVLAGILLISWIGNILVIARWRLHGNTWTSAVTVTLAILAMAFTATLISHGTQ